MKGLYARIAADNIKKNYRFYIPHILTCSGLLGMFYIILTLSLDERIGSMRGGAYITSFMAIGTIVMGILSAVLLLYTNSFLMKQRRREFGLYTVLGMEKKHVGRVLAYETLYSSLISAVLGLAFGILFYKLCALLICRILRNDIVLGFGYIRLKSILPSLLYFAALQGIAALGNRIRIAKLHPVDLLNSRSTGEREPKTKWALLILGTLILGTGYYLAVRSQSPIAAFGWFFVAVACVIVGTYFLFVAGSIFILRLLKRNEAYYYKKRNMMTVSGLLFRMKQNAVGLASIAILATCVIVMLSTTVSLYAGMQKTLERHYPNELYVSITSENGGGYDGADLTKDVSWIVDNTASEHGLAIAETHAERYLEVAYERGPGALRLPENGDHELSGSPNVCEVTYLTEADYAELTGDTLGLGKDEIAVVPISMTLHGENFDGDAVRIGSIALRIRSRLDTFPISASLESVTDCFGIVVSDAAVLDAIDREQKEAYLDAASDYSLRIGARFTDHDLALEKGAAFEEELDNRLLDYMNACSGGKRFYLRTDSLWEAQDNVLGMYGALLFLGILLGLVCLFATALIAYYKQIAEGYEDRNRFQIMEKVGMSDTEVRATVRHQMRTIFFLPLAAAAVHSAAAFPILTCLLRLLLLPDAALFAICAVIVYLLFALVYLLIYAGTARTYYKIIN